MRKARRVDVVELVHQGKNFRQIAKVLGVSVSIAHRDFRMALAERADPAIADLRREYDARLQGVIDGHYAKACAGNAMSAQVVIKAIHEHAQIHGALAPQKVEHSGPAGGAIEVTSSYDVVLQRLARMSDGIAAEGAARSGAAGDDPGGGGTPPV